MATSRRLLLAASALSEILREHQIRHAFYGTITTAVLGSGVNTEVGTKQSLHNATRSILWSLQDIYCIVEGAGNIHPFRRVREALAGNEDWRVTNSPQQVVTLGPAFFSIADVC
jgi:hypothetical protein